MCGFTYDEDRRYPSGISTHQLLARVERNKKIKDKRKVNKTKTEGKVKTR